MSAFDFPPTQPTQSTTPTQPTFEIESLKQRCDNDIKKFNETNSTTSNLTTNLTIIDADVDKAKSNVTAILKIINNNIGNDETYVSKISNITNTGIQNDLWRARTYLFYQMLVIASKCLLDKTWFDGCGLTETETFKFKDFTSELQNFKMGIFGSMTPTSDIDIGIQYSGKSLTEPALAHVVECFESLFVKLTDKSSLDFDIETYADMMTIPDDHGNDVFYLDASAFTKADFEKMLPIAATSIVRNTLLAHAEPSYENYCNFTDGHPGNLFVQKHLNDVIINDATKEMKSFIEKQYDDQRQQYYAAVREAEKAVFEYKNNKDQTKISDLMVLIGKALGYRMESYLCAPTVTHVVRILQADKDSANKYKVNWPKALCEGTLRDNNKAYCTLGKYGYIMSIMEQFGYVYRFHKEYCVEGAHKDATKCEKKKKKYMERMVDGAINMLKRVEDFEGEGCKTTGGKQSRRKKGKKQRRRTKRN